MIVQDNGRLGPMEWATAGRPLPGERYSGDQPLAVDIDGDAVLFGVIDGLGHGPAAASAAMRAVHELLEVTPKLSTAGGTSDGRFIAPMGAQVIELGVINETIHKVNECVRVDDIDHLHQIYFRTLELLLAPGNPVLT